MNLAIIALTCGRPEQTRQTWAANLQPGYPVYWWDNTDGDDWEEIDTICNAYSPDVCFKSTRNLGISHPVNRMMDLAFADGFDAVVTMANDLIEAPDWLHKFEQALRIIPRAGIISTPPGGPADGVLRYPKTQCGHLLIEDGDLIGNMCIPRHTWEMVGHWYDGFGVYGPIDLEYCARVRAAGLRCVYLSQYPSKNIGRDNPADYQKAKMDSLKKSWGLYKERLSDIKAGNFYYRMQEYPI